MKHMTWIIDGGRGKGEVGRKFVVGEGSDLERNQMYRKTGNEMGRKTAIRQPTRLPVKTEVVPTIVINPEEVD